MTLDAVSKIGFAAAAPDAIPVTPTTRDGLAALVASLPASAQGWIATNGFSATRGAWLGLPGASGGLDRMLFGLGDEPALPGDRAFGALPFALPAGVYRLDGGALSAAETERAALGWLLGSYTFSRYKPDDKAPAQLVAPGGIEAARLERIARAACFARDLVNTPAADMSPQALEDATRQIAAAFGAQMAVTVGDDLLTENYPMIHTVGRAAAVPPRLLDLRWSGGDRLSLTIVGKGVCFDTGGLDLKTSAGMINMKKDMGGAAAALALAAMIMDAGLPVRLRVLIPAVENSVGPASFRPGDVLTSRAGITVENRNTDAEGRLVLADALTEAASDAPDIVLDFATLTGAARVAMGADVPPFFTDDDQLATEIAAASMAMDDPLWRLPLWHGYERDISSKVAEITNAPAGGLGGAITAGLFLKRFAPTASTWAHFDIFAWSPKPRPGRPEGGECQGALALYKVIEDRCG